MTTERQLQEALEEAAAFRAKYESSESKIRDYRKEIEMLQGKISGM
jgi:hypothetical protein